MARDDGPGAVAAHGLAGEIDAIGIDGEAAFRLVEATHDVAVADAQVLGVAAPVRLDVDRAFAFGDGMMPRVDAPPIDVLGIARVIPMQ